MEFTLKIKMNRSPLFRNCKSTHLRASCTLLENIITIHWQAILPGKRKESNSRARDAGGWATLALRVGSPVRRAHPLPQPVGQKRHGQDDGNGPAATNGTAAEESEQKAWAEKVTKFANETSKKYPVMTDEEKMLLAQG